jgi:hypothetical protein
MSPEGREDRGRIPPIRVTKDGETKTREDSKQESPGRTPRQNNRSGLPKQEGLTWRI